MISKSAYKVIQAHAEQFDRAIIDNRSFDHSLYVSSSHPVNVLTCRSSLSFCFKSLEPSYLLCINNRFTERPQHMLMRVAVGIHDSGIDRATETYHLTSERCFTRAPPTLFNAGTQPTVEQLLFGDDSIEGI